MPAPDVADPSRATTPVGRRHFSCFDGLRAIAAFAVIFEHLGFQTAASYNTRAGPYLARLDSGVSIFFLISGFLLYRPFVSSHLLGTHPIQTAGFYVRRLVRIFPAYWVALTGIIVFLGLKMHGRRDVVTFYGLLQIYDRHRYSHGITQAWSLATEISFYAFLPLYAYVIGRLVARRQPHAGLAVELGAVVTLAAVGLSFRAYVDLGHASWRVLGIYWLPANVDLFAVGMALAVISVAMEGGLVKMTLAEAAGRHPCCCWAAAGLAFWVVATQFHLPRGLEAISGQKELAKHLGYGSFALLLLLPAVFGPDRAGLIRRFLASRPMVFLGLISYAVYLWHQAFIEKAREWTGAVVAHLGGNFWPVAAITVAATVAVSTASWYLVERPLLRAVHRRSAPTSPTPNTPAPPNQPAVLAS